MVGTEFVLRHALQEGVKITLVVNKIDRLILELRIKPTDAFYKIKHTIEEINSFIRCALIISLYSALILKNCDQCYRQKPRVKIESGKWKCGICKHGHELVFHTSFVRPNVC